MGNIEDYKAKQQELLDTEQKLGETQRQLDERQNELEEAKRKHNQEQNDLINRLMVEVDALQKNAENYEQAIKTIQGELDNLQKNNEEIRQLAQGILDRTEPEAGAGIVKNTGNNDKKPEPEPKPQTQTQPEPEPKPQTQTQPKPEPEPEQKPEQSKPTTETRETSARIINDKLEDLDQRVLRTPEGYITALNDLLYEIENAKSGIVKKGLSKDCKQSLKVSKQNLETLEKHINTIKTSIMRQRNPEISETYINRFNTFKKNIGIIKNDIDSAISGIPKNSTFFYGSISEAERSNKQQRKINQLQSRLKEAVKEGAILSIFNQEEQKAIDFYTRIAERTYTPEDYKLYKEHEGTFDPSFQRCGIELPILDPSQIQTMGGISGMGQQSIQAIDIRSINRGQGTPEGGVPLEQGTQTISQRKPKIDYSNMDLGEAFKVGGLAGVLDKALSNCKNMTPGQRDAWKSIGVLGAYAAGIFGLYKFFTNKDMSFRGKAGITATTIFGAQALTGEGPLSLFNKAIIGGFSADELQDKLGNAFGDAVTGVSNSGMECAPTLSGSMYSMMIFNATTTVGDIRALTASFSDNNEWKTFRENAINKLKSKYGENSAQYFSTNFPEIFDEQKRNTWLASFGITSTAPDNTTNVYKLANNASMNELIIEKFKEQNGVKETSNEVKKKEYNNYINNLRTNNQVLDIETLKANPDWFETDTKATYTERKVDEQNIKALENQVENLPISDPQKKSELKTAIVRFYNERSIEAKPNKEDFSLKMDSDLLILTSHKGQETKINIKLNEIDEFGRSITFTDLSELINTADLANKILDLQKGKTLKSTPAFQSKTGTGGRGIYFNDASTRSFDFDTRVLSGGRGGAIGKIETLSKNQEEFANYLSKRWEEDNKVNLDTATYPILHNLSEKTGITFTNEQEAKNLEIWLKDIKEGKKFAIGNQNGKPFNISWQFKSLNNKLEFTAINGAKEVFKEDISEKFPTIMANKDKFLTFMNDKNNGMRGSALNKK